MALFSHNHLGKKNTDAIIAKMGDSLKNYSWNKSLKWCDPPSRLALEKIQWRSHLHKPSVKGALSLCHHRSLQLPSAETRSWTNRDCVSWRPSVMPSSSRSLILMSLGAQMIMTNLFRAIMKIISSLISGQWKYGTINTKCTFSVVPLKWNTPLFTVPDFWLWIWLSQSKHQSIKVKTP